ncbi:MAG: nucleotidyltransferase family protein [Sphaerochaeta sp.]
MKCVVLAAGYATRMYPLTENFPKPLLEAGGKTILDWMLDDLHSSGSVSSFIVISNHKFIEKFRKWTERKKAQEFEMILLDDGSTENSNRLGAVKDIDFAIRKLSIDDDILVLAGDNLTDFSFASFIRYFNEKRTTCIMRYYVPDMKGPCSVGVCRTDENDRVLSMMEKPLVPESPWAVPPFYIYKKSDLPLFRCGIESGCDTDAPGSFIEWVCTQTAVHAMEMPGKRFDVGSIEGYEKIKGEYRGLIHF